jgi:small subunit ribosomal protein S2
MRHMPLQSGAIGTNGDPAQPLAAEAGVAPSLPHSTKNPAKSQVEPSNLCLDKLGCDSLGDVSSSPLADFLFGRRDFPMANTTELVPELLEAGVHFGHQTKRWNPKMRPYIFEKRNQIYIINLDETVRQLQRATDFLQELTKRGGKILFVGCKKQAQEAIKEAAQACGQFYVNQRWLGGTLTNLATIRKSIGRLKFIEEIEKSPDYRKMGKQEIAALNREGAKLRRNLEGILEMAQLPDALVIIDTPREQNAVNEARRLGIPVVAIVDTNADPEVISYPIAGNDDAIRAIRIVLQKLVDAIVSASGEAKIREQMEMSGVSA